MDKKNIFYLNFANIDFVFSFFDSLITYTSTQLEKHNMYMYFPVTRFEFYLPISQETICKLDSVEPRTKRMKWCNSEEDKEASEALDLSTSTDNVSSVSDIMIRVVRISWFIGTVELQ